MIPIIEPGPNSIPSPSFPPSPRIPTMPVATPITPMRKQTGMRTLPIISMIDLIPSPNRTEIIKQIAAKTEVIHDNVMKARLVNILLQAAPN